MPSVAVVITIIQRDKPMVKLTYRILGDFQINFHLPDYIRLGKSVSRGFGTIKKIDN